MKVRTNYWLLEKEQICDLTCPYCDNKFKAYVGAGSQVVACDVDDSPGCGKEFVVRMPLSVMIDVKCVAIAEE